MDRTESPRYLSVAETSAYLNIPVNTLGFWRHVGRGPQHFKLEGRVLYALEDLEAYVSQARAAGGVSRAATA